jgi:hypothetical protein
VFQNSGPRFGSLRGIGLAAIGAIAIGAGLTVSASGVAWADNELKADPSTVSAGIRPSAIQGDVRTDGDHGVVRNSPKAVPVVKATRQLDDMAATDDWDCLAPWGGKCH